MRDVYSALMLLVAFFATVVVSDTGVEYVGPRYVEEGSTFMITCHATSGSPIKWTRDYVNLEGPEYNMSMKTPTESLRISELEVTDAHTNHTGSYRCLSFIPKSHAISVVFGLTAEVNDSVVVLNLGKDNELTCNTSLPDMKTQWLKDGAAIDVSADQSKYVLNNTNLIIKTSMDVDAGVYVCAINGGEAGNQTTIAKTRARVEKLDKSINLVEGEPLNLTCVVHGYPTPTVIWHKDGVAVKDLNTTRIKLLPSYSNVTDATLMIEHLEDDDRAEYMCVISNDVNVANTTVMIRVKDKLAALWPFLGIVAEVAILCTIIFIYEKRRAKQEYDESDTDQNNESKPVADQKEKDVRQRK